MDKTAYSSMGSEKLYYDSPGNRVRQFIPALIKDPLTLESYLFEANRFARLHGASRRSIQALTRTDILAEIRSVACRCKYKIEAILPLADPFQQYSYVCYGNNDRSRISKIEIEKQEIELADNIISKQRKRLEEIVAQVANNGFIIEKLTERVEPQDFKRILKIAEQSLPVNQFNLESNFKSMIQQPDIYKWYVARSLLDGKIYYVTGGEQSKLVLRHGEIFRVWELTYAGKYHKHVEHQPVKGMNTSIALRFFYEAALRGADLVITEARAAHGAINCNIHYCGQQYGGMLRKHFSLGSGIEQIPESKLDRCREFANLNVWGANADLLRTMEQRVNATAWGKEAKRKVS